MSTAALTVRARKSLQVIRNKLKTQLQVERKLETAAMQDILDWCREHELHEGQRCGAKTFTFDALFLKQIEKTLVQLGQQPLDAFSEQLTRQEQAIKGLDEYKNIGERPRDHRVLVNLLATDELSGFSAWVQRPSRLIIDLDWRQLNLSDFHQLLVIENLDSFYHFASEDLNQNQGGHQQLIVYRGDQHFATACQLLKKSWSATGKALVYSGDFDAKGVNIALNEGYTHLLLPSLAFLQDQAAVLHQPEQQLLYQKSLRHRLQQLPLDHPLVDYLRLIVNEQRGLKQQWFTTEALNLLPLS